MGGEKKKTNRPGSRLWENGCVSSQRHAVPGSQYAADPGDQIWQSQSAETQALISMMKMVSARGQVT